MVEARETRDRRDRGHLDIRRLTNCTRLSLSQGVDSTASSPGPVVAPARGKRSARAYHAEGASSAPAVSPMPSSADLQPGQQPPSSYFAQQHAGQQIDPRTMQQQPLAQNHQYQQQQQHQQHQPQPQQVDPRFHEQQPNSAPGPAPSAADYPPHPSQAPPASFQPSQQPQPISGIPQPPHTAGQRIPPKQRIRIDPDHIPSPVAVQEADQSLYRVEPYLTCSRMAAPLSNTEFVAIDQGLSSSALRSLSKALNGVLMQAIAIRGSFECRLTTCHSRTTSPLRLNSLSDSSCSRSRSCVPKKAQYPSSTLVRLDRRVVSAAGVTSTLGACSSRAVRNSCATCAVPQLKVCHSLCLCASVESSLLT